MRRFPRDPAGKPVGKPAGIDEHHEMNSDPGRPVVVGGLILPFGHGRARI